LIRKFWLRSKGIKYLQQHREQVTFIYKSKQENK
jgi:hypothetical protein